ncbi:MAG: HesA/MoeB/ThiF family protein [bacterium]|nr:HesA/MoeB/ThiF family protein [bacterium]MDT8366762.1 HesA/MoeB/ThiF family protein [bacterium]
MPGTTRPLTNTERDIYSRHLLIPEIGQEGQAKLLGSGVLVIGAGGLGSPALYYLAACGIGRIGIADSDRVEPSNLNRQILHGPPDLGEGKTVSARRSIEHLRPDMEVEEYPFRIDRSNGPGIAASYDFIVEATDNFQSKFLINDICVGAGIAFSTAGILAMYGQTMTVIPAKGPCYRCVFQEAPAPGKVKTAAEAGVLGTVPGILGAIQATEAIKYLLGMDGLLTGALLTFDAAAMAFRKVRLPMDKRCRVCE